MPNCLEEISTQPIDLNAIRLRNEKKSNSKLHERVPCVLPGILLMKGLNYKRAVFVPFFDENMMIMMSRLMLLSYFERPD